MSSPSSTPSPSAKKICFVCGEDCAGKPRLKDPEGRYCCKGCEGKAAGASKPQVVVKSAHVPKSAAAGIAAGAASTSAATPTSPSGAMGFDEDPIDFGSMTEAPAVVSNFVPCPGCNAPTAKGSAICMSCGCNLITGKKAKVKVSKERESNGAVANALVKGNPLIWILAGVVGGAVGAGVWALLAVSTMKLIGLGALAISLLAAIAAGFCTGFGILLVSRERAGFGTGAMSAILAVVAVLVGKYASYSIMIDRILDKAGVTSMVVTDDDVKLWVASDLAKGDGASLFTQSEKAAIERAVEEGDYELVPGKAQKATDQRIAIMSSDELEKTRSRAQADFKKDTDSAIADLKKEVFNRTVGFLDAIWVLAAAMAAYKVGSGGNG